MAPPFASPPQMTDAAGAPVNGALFCTCKARTFTPKAVVSTAERNVAHPNPSQRPNGKLWFPLGDGSYRIRVTDAAGVELPKSGHDGGSQEFVEVAANLAATASASHGAGMVD